MKIKQISGTGLDLSVSNKFVDHYNKTNTFAKYIIDNEINKGLWFDSNLKNLDEYGNIVDIGANVGLFSLYLGGNNRKFYCIEPMKEHCDVILDLFDKFNIHGTVFQGVIHNTNGEVSFENVENNTTCNKVGDGNLKVKSLKLLDFFIENNLHEVELLKLDCEGSEQQIILEDDSVDDALRICKNVFIETHTPPWGNTDEQAIINKLKSLGFKHKKGKRDLSHYFTK